MRQFEIGDRIRIDIPKKDDPDDKRLHRKQSTIIEILEDDADKETRYHRDSHLFRIQDLL
jgi:hypothetical protein